MNPSSSNFASSPIDGILFREEALLLSAKNGNFDEIKNLYESEFDARCKTDALRFSAENGHIKIVKYLVKKGIDLHADDDAALRMSARNGHSKVVEFLVKMGANTEARCHYALKCSVLNGNTDIVKLLVEHELKGLGSNSHEYISRWYNFICCLNVVRCLVENDDAATTKDKPNLGWCVHKGHFSTCKYLSEKQRNNICNADVQLALLTASECGHLEAVTFFIEKDANFNAKNEALRLSAEHGHLDVAKYLVENGSNMLSCDDFGQSALDFAIKNSHQDIISYFENIC